MNRRRLYRSADDRILAGVAAGVADYFDVDPSIVRVIWAVLVVLSGGLMLLVYLVMAVVVPMEPDEWPAAEPWAPGGSPVGGGPVGYPAAYAPPPPGPQGPQPAADTAATQAGESPDPGAGAGAATPETAEGAAPDATGDASTTSSWTTPQGGWTGSGGGFVPPSGGWTQPTGDWRSQRRQERWQRRQDRWQRRQERWESRGFSGGIVFGLLLIVIGGLLAWKQIDPNLDQALVWPLVVIAFGALLVLSSFFGGSRRS